MGRKSIFWCHIHDVLQYYDVINEILWTQFVSVALFTNLCKFRWTHSVVVEFPKKKLSKICLEKNSIQWKIKCINNKSIFFFFPNFSFFLFFYFLFSTYQFIPPFHNNRDNWCSRIGNLFWIVTNTTQCCNLTSYNKPFSVTNSSVYCSRLL